MDYFRKRVDNYGNLEGGSDFHQYQYPAAGYSYQNQPYQVQHEQSTVSYHQQVQYQQHPQTAQLVHPEPCQFLGFNTNTNESVWSGPRFGTEIKETQLNFKSHAVWSPENVGSHCIATATAIEYSNQKSNNYLSELSIYEVDFSQFQLDLTKAGSRRFGNCFSCMGWGKSGTNQMNKGVVAGGLDDGTIVILDVEKLLIIPEDSMIQTHVNNTGQAQSLDFNSFQDNLLAVGYHDSEVIIWDIDHQHNTFSAGLQKMSTSGVKCVEWNKQVSHILASSHNDGCVIWDTKKNESVMKIGNFMAPQMSYNKMAWCPDVATKICLASDSDVYPIIQLWDLRQANSPLQTLSHMQSGITSLSWCKQDGDFLLASARDFQIVCVNPNSLEIQGLLASSNQECFHLDWCPTNPAAFLTSFNDGKVSVYSIFGSKDMPSPGLSLADSFPDLDSLAPCLQPDSVEKKSQSVQFKQPPKWLKRPCGASFVFGGRLLTFTSANVATSNTWAEATISQSSVYLSKSDLERDFKSRSSDLLNCATNMSEFCQAKIGKFEMENDKEEVWKFLLAKQDKEPVKKVLELLQPSEKLGFGDFNDTLSDSDDKESSENDEDEADPGQSIEHLLLSGNLTAAIQKLLIRRRVTDALALAVLADKEVLSQVQNKYLKSIKNTPEFPIVRALLHNNWSDYICKLDLNRWRDGLIGILSNSESSNVPMLCSILGNRLRSQESNQAALICYLIAGNLEQFADCWSITSTNKNIPIIDLQEFMEVYTILRRSEENIKRSAQKVTSDLIRRKIHQYVTILAFNGALEEAICHLEENHLEDASLMEMKSQFLHILNARRPKETKKGTWFQSSENNRQESDAFTTQRFQVDPLTDQLWARPQIQVPQNQAENFQHSHQRVKSDKPQKPKTPQSLSFDLIPIQSTFEELFGLCSQVASNPQTIRKLEEVRKRLNILYEKLGENLVSQDIIGNLHEIIYYVNVHDYHNCMTTVQKMAGSRSFAQLTEFLPGIKILLQLATVQNIFIHRT